jgi:hypothetical protein
MIPLPGVEPTHVVLATRADARFARFLLLSPAGKGWPENVDRCVHPDVYSCPQSWPGRQAPEGQAPGAGRFLLLSLDGEAHDLLVSPI